MCLSLASVKYLIDSVLKDSCNTLKEISNVFPCMESWLCVFCFFSLGIHLWGSSEKMLC